MTNPDHDIANEPAPAALDGRIAWRGVVAALLGAFVAVVALTPMFVALGARPRRAAQHVLRFAFMAGLVVVSRPKSIVDVGTVAGLLPITRALRRWWLGFGVGVVGLLVWSLLLLAFDERTIKASVSVGRVLGAVAGYLPLAFLIGFLEDMLFFGLLYAVLGRRILPAAVFYAVGHFLGIGRDVEFTNTSTSGWEAAGHMLRNLVVRIPADPLAFVGLIVVGGVLCVLRREDRGLWTAMGLHGGWYFVRQVGRKWSRDVEGDAEWAFGTSVYYDGVLGWVMLIASGVAIVLWVRRRERVFIEVNE